MKKLNELKQAITTRETGEVVAQIGMMEPFVVRTNETDTIGPSGFNHNIGVVTEIRIGFNYHAPSDKLHIASRSIQKAIMRHLYGEVRGELFHILHGLHMRDEFRHSEEVTRLEELVQSISSLTD